MSLQLKYIALIKALHHQFKRLKEKTMSQNEFILACSQYYIDPAIALESEAVINAIKSGDLDKLHEVLQNEC
jgi:hypothetical protein